MPRPAASREEHGLDRVLRDEWLGTLCRLRVGVTDSFGDLDAPADSLTPVDATASPHNDGEEGLASQPDDRVEQVHGEVVEARLPARFPGA